MKHFVIIKHQSQRVENKNFQILNGLPLWKNLINELAGEDVYIGISGTNMTLYELRINSGSTHKIIASATGNTLTCSTLTITNGGLDTNYLNLYFTFRML